MALPPFVLPADQRRVPWPEHGSGITVDQGKSAFLMAMTVLMDNGVG